MAILGAHMSIAGGYHKAVEAAKQAGCDCVQLFCKNNNQWRAKPITPEEASRFRQTLAELHVGYPLVHCSYLINLASPDELLWQKSIDALVMEIERTAQLGIPYVVVHPGAYVSSSEQAGLQRIVLALREVQRRTAQTPTGCLLETTAGQGSNLGNRFEHLARILDELQAPSTFGVCLDTCHLWAAGYPLVTLDEYHATIDQLKRCIALDQVKAIHLNDSKQPLGSRKDRHEHIGHGHLGLEPFRRLLNDARFLSIPMYLETPKGDHEGMSWDEINLATLRGLVR
jgi:deoxyribonuclease IV